MGAAFLHGAGGSYERLNFQVVNSTTEPSRPKENMIWVNSSWVLHLWEFVPEMPLRKSKNRNFVTYPYYSNYREVAGLTFTNLTQSNGTNTGKFTVNGTATSRVQFRANHNTVESGMFLLPAGSYIMSGCPAGGSTESGNVKTYALQLNCLNDGGDPANVDDWSIFKFETGSGRTFTVEKDTLCHVCFVVANGVTVNNLEVYFQIEKGSTKTEFIAGNSCGQLWFNIAHNGPATFKPFKKIENNNNIVFAPAPAYVFSWGSNRANATYNNCWRQATCHIYQNGAWVPFVPDSSNSDDPVGMTYYYKAGDQRTSITGGWTKDNWNGGNYDTQQPLAAINSDHLYVEGRSGCLCMIGTTNKVNLSGIDTLKANVEITRSGVVALAIASDKNHNAVVVETRNTSIGTHEFSLDVKNCDSSYHIMVYALGTSDNAAPIGKITNVWGE